MGASEWHAGIVRIAQRRVEAAVSPRHLSFVETGRAVPSREMVLTLARALDVPFRERNAMLSAAGYAAVYRETSLDDPQMAEMRHALELCSCASTSRSRRSRSTGAGIC